MQALASAKEGSTMCPMCVGSAASMIGAIAASAASAGGLTAFVVRKLRPVSAANPSTASTDGSRQ